jgi:hypothetical protein
MFIFPSRELDFALAALLVTTLFGVGVGHWLSEYISLPPRRWVRIPALIALWAGAIVVIHAYITAGYVTGLVYQTILAFCAGVLYGNGVFSSLFGPLD